MQQKKIPLSIVDSINERLGSLISYGILLMMGITIYEVVLRYTFNRPTFWAHETVSMLHVAYVILVSGFTIRYLASPRHIKMDVLYARLSPRKKVIVELVASTAFFLFVGVILWQGWEMAWRSSQLGEHTITTWGPPLYPTKWCIPVGAFLMLVQGVANFIRNLSIVISGTEAAA